MNVLFLTKYPYIGASSRYRVFQYLPFLKELGITYDVQSFMDDKMYKNTFKPGRTLFKVYLTIKAISSRLTVLTRFYKYDIIYMQRECFPFGSSIVHKILRLFGKKVILDYDDALFVNKANKHNVVSSLLRKLNDFNGLVENSDAVIAGNKYLSDYAKPLCKSSFVLEVAEDTNRILGKSDSYFMTNEIITIGWLGSSSTAKYLHLIKHELIKIHKEFPDVVFEVVGSDPDFSIPGLPLKLTPWSLDGELSALGRFDIGLMPLPNETWSNGKSGGKARTYMAAGVVPVVSNIGYNKELIIDRKNGFLVSDNYEWSALLRELILSSKLRKGISFAARRHVTDNFDVKETAMKMHNIFKLILSDR